MKQLEYPIIQILDDRGEPLASGLVYIYDGNSSTLASVYTDSSLNTASTNPITLDSRGIFSVYIPYGKAYSYTITDSSGKVIHSKSNLFGNLDGTISTTETEDNIRTITISSTRVYLSTVTSSSNTDITITPDSSIPATFGPYVSTNTDINTNGYNIKNLSTGNLSVWPNAEGTTSSSGEHYRVPFYFTDPEYSVDGGYMTIKNNSTGQAPYVELTSSAASRAIKLNTGYSSSMSGNMIHISGVDYKTPSGTNTYLKSNGDGTTKWEA